MTLDMRRRGDRRKGRYARVTLNGRELPHCVKVDTRRGVAVVVDYSTRRYPRPTVTLRGRVRLYLRQEAAA